MQKSLTEIAGLLNCTFSGDPDELITALAPIKKAKAGELTFLSNIKFISFAQSSSASAFIVTKEMTNKIKDKNLIISNNPQYSFARLLNIFHKKEKAVLGIDKNVFIAHNTSIAESVSIYPNVYIGEGAVIDEGVVIYPGCFIGENVNIGNNTIIYPNVVIREGSIIGKNVIIQPGVIIGGDGFGYILNEGEHFKIPQIGIVVIEDNVEIGANVTIDRAAMEETIIGEGTKIDNLVMVAHNVKIGKKNILVSQSGAAGSAELGDYVTVGGQTGINGHIKIGNNVFIAGKSGVTSDVKDGETVAGYPSVQISKWRKAAVLSNRLPELNRKIRELESRLKKLEEA